MVELTANGRNRLATKREKPSTKARREGYRQLHKLKTLLTLLLYGQRFVTHADEDSKLDKFAEQFKRDGWRDFMVKYIPSHKRGGPAIQQPSKKRKRKLKERQATIR